MSEAIDEMSEDHFDKYEHYNYDQDKAMMSGHGGKQMFCIYQVDANSLLILGKQRTKKEVEMNTNRHNPGGHERKITTKLMNMEKNLQKNDSSKSKI